MKVPDSLRFYSAGTFPPLGFPIAITAVEASHDLNRCAEFHLFLFQFPDGHTVRSRRYSYDGIPEEIIPNESLHQDALRVTQAELDAIVLEGRSKMTADVIPHSFKYDLMPCSPESVLLALIRRKPKELNTIRDQTQSTDLEKFLPTAKLLRDWTINEG